MIETEEKRLFSKIAWRLMPVLILAYILNYLDRTNIGFAALTMNQAIGLTATQFGLGAGIFFLGYCLLEVPSNVALYRFGARRWISRIMISWGLVSAATIVRHRAAELLPAAPAPRRRRSGVLPGRRVLPRHLVPGRVPHADHRLVHGGHSRSRPSSAARCRALLLAIDGIAGLAGWQWLFLLEGLPACVLGFVVADEVMPDRPEDATWLTDDERRIVRDRLAGESRPQERCATSAWRSATRAS